LYAFKVVHWADYIALPANVDWSQFIGTKCRWMGFCSFSGAETEIMVPKSFRPSLLGSVKGSWWGWALAEVVEGTVAGGKKTKSKDT
jgi:hypothetical protein